MADSVFSGIFFIPGKNSPKMTSNCSSCLCLWQSSAALSIIVLLPDSLVRLSQISSRPLGVVHCLGRTVPVQSWQLISRNWMLVIQVIAHDERAVGSHKIKKNYIRITCCGTAFLILCNNDGFVNVRVVPVFHHLNFNRDKNGAKSGIRLGAVKGNLSL